MQSVSQALEVTVEIRLKLKVIAGHMQKRIFSLIAPDKLNFFQSACCPLDHRVNSIYENFEQKISLEVEKMRDVNV